VATPHHSIPLAMMKLCEQKIQQVTLLPRLAFGASLTWGTVVFK